MKYVLITIVLFLFFSTSFSQKKDSLKSEYRLGVILGGPGPILLSLGQDFDKYSYRISLGAWLNQKYGTQAELIYNIYRNETFEQHTGLIAGFCYAEKLTKRKFYSYIYQENMTGEYTHSFYSGLSYRINWTNIFIQSSIAIGTNNFKSPLLVMQVGYYFNLK